MKCIRRNDGRSAEDTYPMLNNPALRAPISIALGAIAGALSRYSLGLLISQLINSSFPVATFTVNLIGCFLMGLFIRLPIQAVQVSPELKLLIFTGFLGSFTTFSSYGLETAVLFNREGWLQDIIYWLGSPLMGLLSLSIGVQMAQRFVRSHKENSDSGLH